jgi:biotin carboxyl carrier protein
MQDLFIIQDVQEDTEITAALVRRRDGFLLLQGDHEYPVGLHTCDDGAVDITVGNRVWRAHIATAGDDTFIRVNGECYMVRWSNPLVRLAQAGKGALEDIAQAPMPGTVISVQVQSGDQVIRGQTLMIIESMKLETAILAWRDGTVETVHLAQGQTFDRTAALITLAAESKE